MSGGDLVLAAEMEPFDPEAEDTRVRLLVYGRAGFKIVDLRALPYCQPDYREHALIDADRVRPVPLLAVVRWVGHETARAIPRHLAAAFVEHLYRIVGAHCQRPIPRRAGLMRSPAGGVSGGDGPAPRAAGVNRRRRGTSSLCRAMWS